jgi:hypothetical protein
MERSNTVPYDGAKQRGERLLGSGARDGVRLTVNHGVVPRRGDEQREESRDEWRVRVFRIVGRYW